MYAEMNMALETLPVSGQNAEMDMAIETLPVSGLNAETDIALEKLQVSLCMQRWTWIFRRCQYLD
jgi:hypothetical protein